VAQVASDIRLSDTRATNWAICFESDHMWIDMTRHPGRNALTVVCEWRAVQCGG